ncbi:hypothetical protein M9434_002547 [Picochlorum sp. BPE23]|nr:hypothetical protein M9434_002547 [Picochlorum sp. BPE23]
MGGFSSAEGQALGDPSFSREERSYLMDHGRAKKRTSTSNGKNGVWSDEEDRLLAEWQKKVGNKWSEVAKHISGKTGQQCAQRWRHRVNPDIKRDKWDAHEDELLTNLVAKHGNAWAEIARHVPGRTDQQCMGRWKRHLDPSIRREKWSDEEDVKLCALFSKYDNAWSSISKAMRGRTPQQCRTRWHNLKSSSFMTKRKEDIQKVDMEALEALLAQHERSLSAARESAMGQKDEKIEGVGYQKKRKRGRPAKSEGRMGDSGTDVLGRMRGRPRRRTMVSHIETRNLSFLDCMKVAGSRSTCRQRRLNFESTRHMLKMLKDGEESQSDHALGQFDDCVLQPWSAAKANGRNNIALNNLRWEENGEDDGEIMLPINKANMMVCVSPFPNKHSYEPVVANDATPPKPKSKREVLDAHHVPSPLRQNPYAIDTYSGESFLGIEDLMGSKTPLSALRHAPKSCFSPALADLLKSPPNNHDMSHVKSIEFQGFGSPAAHYNRAGQLWGQETPSRDFSEVVRCLDADIEFACERAPNGDFTGNDVAMHETNRAHPESAPLFTPSGMAMPFHAVDSTPNMAHGSVMMKGNNHEISVVESIPTRYVAVESTDQSETAKLLPVRLLPSSQTSEQLHLSVGEGVEKTIGTLQNKATLVPVHSNHQQDTLKRRARRLSSASVRMSLHTLLEKV